MTRRLAVLVTTVCLSAPIAAPSAEIGYIEDFALARDRAAALQQLIPGSPEYYYYHCLHYQNIEQFDQVEELLKNWIKRYKYTPQVVEILNRQALLTYDQDPGKSLEHIRQQLQLRFQHQRERVGEKPDLPTRLNPTLIHRQQLSREALRRHKNLDGFEDSALDWLAQTELDAARRRHLLERLSRPDHTDLPQLVVADLNHRPSRPFGSLRIHRQLLREQLEACLAELASLLNQTNFVNIYLSKLRPGEDVDWRNDSAQQLAYLERLWSFARRLAPVHNSLKAHILYHRLVLDRSQGVYDKQRFMSYIQLPRKVSYMAPRYMALQQNRRYAADLTADFGPVTQLPIVGDDEPLVRSYLQYFFVNETTIKPYEPYLSDRYLREQLAETKVVNGLGEPEQWYSWLTPAKFQALKDRIDLDFAYTNRNYYAADESVSLELEVKNVRKLIVKVFEINTQSYYRSVGKEVNTDIHLDGLLPNQEYTFEYAEPPLRRVRRRFDFPELDRAGVYVVDFIGNGISSRAVIRKGKLRQLARVTPSGHLLSVFDEQNRLVKDATIWLSGHEYQPLEDGTILLPFSTRPRRQSIVISRGEFSSLDHFQHQAENYRLAAGIYVDRESLLRQARAKVLLRPALYLNDVPVGLSVLEDTRLQIATVDTDGVVSTKEIQDFKLFLDRESVHEFQVPPRLAQITFTLNARVKSFSRNKQLELSSSEQFELNQIDNSDKIEDLHLLKSDGQYMLELLGKSGEAKPDRPVQLALKHRDFKRPARVTLQSDLRGRIWLGQLADIESVTATAAQGAEHTWQLAGDQHTYHRTLHAVAGTPIEIPYMGAARVPLPSELSLLEVRGSTFLADRFEALSIEDGLLRISDLPPGDYDLYLKRAAQRIRLRIAKGSAGAGYALGKYRWLELRGRQPLQIHTVDADADEVRIQLVNSNRFARVHVLATRYVPAFSVFDKLGSIRDAEPNLITRPRSASQFVAGRNIGDEYQYIIDRKYATKYPGNMLDRPSALLNPFATRDTETGQQRAAAGADFAPAAPDGEAAARRAPSKKKESAQQGTFTNLDFLAQAATVLLNLSPDEEGVVTVPRGDLGDRQLLHVVAVDPVTTAYRSTSLPAQQTQFRDLRLRDGLNPEQHYTQQRRVSVVDGGKIFRLDDIVTSRFEVYDSLRRVYALYMTMSRDSKLAEFGFVLDWPQLDKDEKRTRYSKYACHELNFFLYHKDRPFFLEVVRPYLAHKRDRTFLDDWLLGRKLTGYLEPWAYSQLNAAERILLSKRNLQDLEYTRRDIRDRFDLLPPNVDRFNQLFMTAIKGSSLDVADPFGFAEAAVGERLRRFSAQAPPPGGSMRGGMGGGGGGLGGMAQPQEGDPESESLEMADRNRAARPSTRGRQRDSDGAKLQQTGPDELFDQFFARPDRFGEARRLYQTLDTTREWAENNYYQLPIQQQDAELIQVNGFWNDYVEQDPMEPFYSVHFVEAARNFSEMMFALALLDLPYEAEQHETKYEQASMTLKAGSPLVVFHEEISETTSPGEKTPILVSQNFFRHGDRYLHAGNERSDKFVSDEFLVHTVYGSQVVVTNPTSAAQQLDVLVQIPVGSLPVLKGQPTRSVHLDLKPYATETIEYYFYFPQAGTYPHYPVHVAKNAQLLAHAEPFQFTVVERLSRVDRASWDYISQHGSGQDVLDYLQQHNLHRTDLKRIAFRMADHPFFLEVIDLLEKRHAYDHTLWSYGVKHNHVPAIRQFLQHENEFVERCGAWLQSPLLTIDPVVRRVYEHLDYRPLVNARAHRLGRRRQIVNQRLLQQYHKLLKILCYRRQLAEDDLLAMTYYMLLQDRIAEAIELFEQTDRTRLDTRLQYDYFSAYLALYREDIAAARETAARYADHPVDRWRKAFLAVDKQLDEIESGGIEVLDPDSRQQTQSQLAATEPSFEFDVESKQVAIRYQNLDRLTANYYLMDIELLFSRNPFVQQFSGQFSFIRPNRTQTIELPGDQTEFAFPLPAELRNGNVLIEMVGAGQAKSHAYYANSLSLQVIENYGQLRVTDDQRRGALPKVYVKVYARFKDGSVRFYKDGYTDLRGRFDYTSLNTNDLDQVDRFALLVISDEHGAVVREAAAPTR